MKISKINEKMVRNVFLNTEILINEDDTEIFEYDIQNYMFQFFRRYLKGTPYSVAREKTGKVDCVLYEDAIPKVFYEIKTYFKNSEQIRISQVNKDLQKLSDLIKTHSGSVGYFFTSGLRSKYENSNGMAIPFIKSRIEKNTKWFSYQLPSTQKIRLRPSRWEKHGRNYTMTWEVKI